MTEILTKFDLPFFHEYNTKQLAGPLTADIDVFQVLRAFNFRLACVALTRVVEENDTSIVNPFFFPFFQAHAREVV